MDPLNLDLTLAERIDESIDSITQSLALLSHLNRRVPSEENAQGVLALTNLLADLRSRKCEAEEAERTKNKVCEAEGGGNISEESQIPESTSEFQAVVVDKVDENDLLRGTDTAGPSPGQPLPVAPVKLPVDDLSQIAILSWRWDGDNQGRGSRNIASAIRQAKKLGIRYLFIDMISIDQNLSGDALLEQVVAFSTLYKTIPVIAAYDKIGEDFRNTTRRPWISSEMRLFRYNPTKVVYVGHNDQGAEWDPGLSNGYDPGLEIILGKPKPLLEELSNFEFGDVLERTWRSSFTYTIFGVLCNQIGMAEISDLKFIMPEHARALTAAYEKKWPRNDYLLTAAILCQLHSRDKGRNSWAEIASLKFDRYTRKYRGSDQDWTEQDIFLDGIQVATLLDYENDYSGTVRIELTALQNAERVIFAALGLTNSDYLEQKEKRYASAMVKHESDAPPPKVEVVSVSL
jgi:hypothetical protein